MRGDDGAVMSAEVGVGVCRRDEHEGCEKIYV